MSFTNYLSAAILNHIFSKSPYIAPSLYVGLSNGADTEPSTGSYARVLVPAADWSAATNADPSVISNVATIVFPVATADWLSGTQVTRFGLYDAATSGNLLASGLLDSPKVIFDGDTASFPAGTLIFSLS